MSKHTPGPWKLVGANKLRIFNHVSVRPVNPCFKGCALPIAKVTRADMTEYGGGSGDADARLIAAAPDLLAALQELVPLTVAAMSDANDDGASYDADMGLFAARAAITKATGETP